MGRRVIVRSQRLIAIVSSPARIFKHGPLRWGGLDQRFLELSRAHSGQIPDALVIQQLVRLNVSMAGRSIALAVPKRNRDPRDDRALDLLEQALLATQVLVVMPLTRKAL